MNEEGTEFILEVSLSAGAMALLDAHLSTQECLAITREDLIREAIEAYLAFLLEKKLH